MKNDAPKDPKEEDKEDDELPMNESIVDENENPQEP